MLNQHAQIFKKISVDGPRIVRHQEDSSTRHQELSSRYERACREAEDSANESFASCSLPPAQRMKLAARSLALCKQAQMVEKEYHQSVAQANAARQLYDKQMGLILDTLQDMEEKRLQCFRDAMMKLTVYEASVKAAEAIDPKEDLQNFIRANRSPAPPQEIVA